VQSTPLRVEQDRRFFIYYHVLTVFPAYDGGAADAQAVRPGSLLVVFYIATSTSNAAPFDISAFSSEKSAG
jgi:hypothetical protein